MSVAMWLTIEMRAEYPCIECEVPVRLTGLRHMVRCHGCGARFDIEKVFDEETLGPRYWFGAHCDALADVLVNPEARNLSGTDGDSLVKLNGRSLACACGGPLPYPQSPATQITCAACQASTPVRWPDPGTARWDPRLVCVVGDGGESDVAASGAEHPFFLVYQLDEPAQLALLRWTRAHPRRVISEEPEEAETEEDANASGSETDSDEDEDDEDADDVRVRELLEIVDRRLALLLGPPALQIKRALASRGPIDLATLREVVVLPELGEFDAIKLDARCTDEQRIALFDLPIAKLTQLWSRASFATTRSIAANAPELDPATLATLASDGEASVRLAIAGRADVPAQILATLRKDRDKTVQAAAKANPAHKIGLLARLFGG